MKIARVLRGYSAGERSPKNYYMNKHIQTEINPGLSLINILMFVDICIYS